MAGLSFPWGKKPSRTAYGNRIRSRDQPSGTGQQRPPVRLV